MTYFLTGKDTRAYFKRICRLGVRKRVGDYITHTTTGTITGSPFSLSTEIMGLTHRMVRGEESTSLILLTAVTH